MATVDSTIDGIIAAAQATAERQIDLMNEKVDEAINLSRGRAFGTFDEEINPSAPVSIELERPTLTFDQLVSLHDPQLINIKEDIDREFDDFLDKYFPSFSPLSSETIQWIRDTIESGGEALPGTVEGKIWDRARSREDALNQTATHEAVESMARRGWDAAPGVLTERLRVAQMENTLRKSSLSRDIAIAQAEMAHEMLKFAVSQSVAIQSLAMQAAAAFISEIVRAHAIALTNSASLANAAVNLYGNTIAFYQAHFSQEELKRTFAEANADLKFEGTALNVEELTKQIQTSASTAVEAARALGDSAAAALGAQNTMAATIQEITEEA